MKPSSTVTTLEIVFTFDKLTAELFYPNRLKYWEITQVATTLSSEAETLITTELIDNTKSTSKHLSCIQRDYIMSEATEQMKQYGICKKAINSVSDSVFALFKESIAKPGRIRFDRYSEESSSCFNKHFNRGHKDFINGRRKNRINQKDIVVVLLHNIPE